MKHMPLTTLVLTFLSRTLVTLALSFAFAWVLALSCAQTETSIPFADTSLPPVTEMSAHRDASLYALSGNSVTTSIRISDGNLVGCVSLTIRQGHHWVTSLTLQKQTANQSWSTVVSSASSKSEFSIARNVPSGFYRLKVSVKVYDSDGNVIDSVSRYSKVVQQQ